MWFLAEGRELAMAVSSVPLTALSEDQRAQAHTRFTIIRPALEDGITQAQVARTHNIPASMVRRWVKRYRENLPRRFSRRKGTFRQRQVASLASRCDYLD